MNPAQHVLSFAVRVYRWGLSPFKTVLFGPLGRCRYMPTCSAYALEAIRTHGALVGSGLALKRICRCHPWGGCGLDPVPEHESNVRSPKPEIVSSSIGGRSHRGRESILRPDAAAPASGGPTKCCGRGVPAAVVAGGR